MKPPMFSFSTFTIDAMLGGSCVTKNQPWKSAKHARKKSKLYCYPGFHPNGKPEV